MGYIGRVNFDLNVILVDYIGDVIIMEIWWVYEGCFLESGKFIVLGFGKGGGICFWSSVLFV